MVYISVKTFQISTLCGYKTMLPKPAFPDSMDGAGIHAHIYPLLLQCHDANAAQGLFSKIALTWPADRARIVHRLSEHHPKKDVWMPSAEKRASFFLQLVKPSRRKIVMQLLAQTVSKLVIAKSWEISQEGSLCVALFFYTSPEQGCCWRNGSRLDGFAVFRS